ncbi:TcaA NTF2-like domain-containing protein [Macrococcus animalis]|uniref:TcaA NTF2-like domain-containing protein n=2 Tax=Macrococcus animalis TaxID=3395467 RepID=UPI0039BDE335
MKYILGILACVFLIFTTGCSNKEEKIMSAKSARKAQYLYQWSGSKKDDIMLVNSAVKHFFDRYAEAYNKGNYNLLTSTVKKGSIAENEIKAEIESGKFSNMVVYSNTIDKITTQKDEYIAIVGKEISNMSTSERTYSETLFHFSYDKALKQMMITQVSDLVNSELKVKDKSQAQKDAKGNGVVIDVLSTDFQNKFFMDNSRFVGGIANQMSFQVIKDKYGDFTDHTIINQKKYYIFGNAGVSFNKQLDDKSTGAESVQDMVIVPEYMLYQDVIAFYGQPDKERLDDTDDPRVIYENEIGTVKVAFHLSTNKKEVEYVEKLK